MPRFGLALTKKAVNQCEDLMGMRTGMDSVFGLHHLAHAHNAEIGTDSLGGMDAKSMAASARSSNEGPSSGSRLRRRRPLAFRDEVRALAGAPTCPPSRCRRWTPPRASRRTASGNARSPTPGCRWCPGRRSSAAATRRCWSG